MPRIEPVSPPYEPATRRQLDSMMPPGTPPILLFRTFAKNAPMTSAMGTWGRYELSRDLSLSMRAREILIDRTCARCHCEYEWGVHVAFFADRVGLDTHQVRSLTHGDASDPCWTDERDGLLIRVADALHETSTVPDDLFEQVHTRFTEAECLDMFMLCGWYHAISYVANACAVDREPFAPTFDDYAPEPTASR